MSSPYIYAPDVIPQYINEFHYTPYYYHTPHIHTPFLPTPAQSTTTALPPVTPTSARQVPFPGYGYVSWNARPLARQPSGHGPSSARFDQSGHPSFPGRNVRRHSFSAPSYRPPPQPQSAPWSAPPYVTQSPQPIILNPWIDASSLRQDFNFDLAITAFTPLRLLGPGQPVMISAEDMREVATYPPLRCLRIVCDFIPNWPIDLEFRPSNPTLYSPYSPNQVAFRQQPSSPPITLFDVHTSGDPPGNALPNHTRRLGEIE